MGSGEDLIHHLTPGDQEVSELLLACGRGNALTIDSLVKSISTRSSPSTRKEAINHSHLQIVVNPSHAEK